MVEKYIESLQKAVKNLRIADHMAYVTYPIIKDKRLLLKILEQTSEALVLTINAILQYDYLWKKINLYRDVKSNFQVFSEKCAPRYNITPDCLSKIIEIFSINEKHKKSAIEFTRRDKIVIMADSLRANIIDLEKIKQYLNLSKKIFGLANAGMKTS